MENGMKFLARVGKKLITIEELYLLSAKELWRHEKQRDIEIVFINTARYNNARSSKCNTTYASSLDKTRPIEFFYAQINAKCHFLLGMYLQQCAIAAMEAKWVDDLQRLR